MTEVPVQTRAAEPPEPWQPRWMRRPRWPHHLLAYLISIPERILRWLLGLVAHALILLSRVLPRPIREGRFYKLSVQRHLKMLTDEIAQAGLFPAEKDDGVVTDKKRMVIGGAVDNLLILGLHASPVWILLAATDVSKGAAAFTKELGRELKDAGVMAEGSRLDSVDDVLGGLSRLTNRMAETIDTPPLSLEDMKKSVGSVRKEIEEVGTTAWQKTANIDGLANDLMEVAHEARRPLLEVASGVAVGSVRKAGALVWGTLAGAGATVTVAGRMLWRDVMVDYGKTLRRMHRQGFYGTLRRGLRPQLRSTRRLFAYRFLTFTEIGLSFGMWRTAAWRLGGGS